VQNREIGTGKEFSESECEVLRPYFFKEKRKYYITVMKLMPLKLLLLCPRILAVT